MSWESQPSNRAQVLRQYSLMALLVFVAVVAIICAISRTFGIHGLLLIGNTYVVFISMVNLVGRQQRIAKWVPKLTIVEILVLFGECLILNAILLPAVQVAR